MSSSIVEARASEDFTAAVITVSDSCARGERQDVSGPSVADILKKHGFHVITRQVVSDDQIKIQNLLIRLATEVRFIATTGGTGIAARDVTPEATRAICDRVIHRAHRLTLKGPTMRDPGTRRSPKGTS